MLCADRFTAADISVGYALRLAENIGLAKDFGPNVAAYWQRLQARDGYQARGGRGKPRRRAAEGGEAIMKSRAPDAVQHAKLRRGAPLSRGRQKLRALGGPGSAKQRLRSAASRPGHVAPVTSASISVFCSSLRKESNRESFIHERQGRHHLRAERRADRSETAPCAGDAGADGARGQSGLRRRRQRHAYPSAPAGAGQGPSAVVGGQRLQRDPAGDPRGLSRRHHQPHHGHLRAELSGRARLRARDQAGNGRLQRRLAELSESKGRQHLGVAADDVR